MQVEKAPREDETAGPGKPVEKGASGPMILIAEDEPALAIMLERMLTLAGYGNTMLAVNADEVLVRLDADRENPDLILLDLNMPGMDGVELLRHIGSRNYAGSLALVSGEDLDVLNASRDLAIAHGVKVAGILQKPVEAVELVALVEVALNPVNVQIEKDDVDIIPQDIEDALDNGEFEIHYQPKALIHDRVVIGVEALLRWRHPKIGWISPGVFIPLAEHVGLIDGITEYVLRTAIAQAGQWMREGLELELAINLSADCLHERHYPDLIAGLVRDAGYDPRLLTLEITETKLMRDPKMALEVLTRLRMKGFGLSVDDFGTGYSSMEQLRRMPFSELKVDRAFVHGAQTDPKALAILETSTWLGRQLDLKIVAEGVEDQDDLDRVSALDCDVVQGYYLARAMPGDKIADWVKSRMIAGDGGGGQG